MTEVWFGMPWYVFAAACIVGGFCWSMGAWAWSSLIAPRFVRKP